MKLVAFLLLIISTFSSSAHAKDHLFFGITDNHRPHVYLNDEEQPSGSLIDYLSTLCADLDVECSFQTNNFFNHIEQLQGGQINALLVTDSVLLPATDEIIFTPPICKTLPIFIYKIQSDKPVFKSIDQFKNITIGVHQDSSYHLYLLDEYHSHSLIKPYSLIESGIFDLANDRIDALLAEKSFFEARVATTTLASKKKNYYLEMIELGKINQPFKTMSLALKKEDTELHEKFTKAINAHGPTVSCVDLVRKALKKDNSTELPSDASQSELLTQGNGTNETIK